MYVRKVKETGYIIHALCRKYAVRRTQDGFRSNKDVSDTARIQQLIQEAEENLKMMQRQVNAFYVYVMH